MADWSNPETDVLADIAQVAEASREAYRNNEGPARWTEHVPLTGLRPNPANPKAHDNALIDASVGRFGFVEPLVVDERTGYLISGHGRRETLIAMRERGETAPEGVQVSDDGEWMVPVSRGWRSRTDTEALAALVALNRTSEVGGWEDAALLALLDDITDLGDEAFVGVGFGEDDLDDLRAKLDEMAATLDGFGTGDDTVPDGDGFEGNTQETPGLKEHAATYAEQGRRLIVLDYTVDEYPQVTARLKALREARGVDNNAEALAGWLAETFPDAVPESAADAQEDALRALGMDNSDPAATLDKDLA